MKCLTIDPRSIDIDATVERGALLHGHFGPFLVVGIRMGLLALELLEHPGYFGLEAHSEAGWTPPLSCLNDGIQIGAGCTTGKGNLIVAARTRPCVRFTTESGRSATIELRREILAEIRGGQVDEFGTTLRHRPSEELFEWTIA
ncbi:MAG: formylmethanofuran dehydrogenase subunit E family protein [Thermotogota bacterium]